MNLNVWKVCFNSLFCNTASLKAIATLYVFIVMQKKLVVDVSCNDGCGGLMLLVGVGGRVGKGKARGLTVLFGNPIFFTSPT